MKKTLVLLAGYPGTGKSYLCDQILAMAPDFVIVSLDSIKEKRFDELGYDTLEEKEAITQESWQYYYRVMESNMKEGKRLISDYPFSQKQYPKLKELCTHYGYESITIRLLADIDVLYERQRIRDLDPSRHLSHIMSHYHLGDCLQDRLQADGLLSYQEFYERCKTRGYDTFQLGMLIEADVTDFSKVDYPYILHQVKQAL